MRTKYSYRGAEFEVIRCRWFCHPAGRYFVRRVSKTGYITGHLTDRNGWGSPLLAKPFFTAQEAADAAHKINVRFFVIMENLEHKPSDSSFLTPRR